VIIAFSLLPLTGSCYFFFLFSPCPKKFFSPWLLPPTANLLFLPWGVAGPSRLIMSVAFSPTKSRSTFWKGSTSSLINVSSPFYGSVKTPFFPQHPTPTGRSSKQRSPPLSPPWTVGGNWSFFRKRRAVKEAILPLCSFASLGCLFFATGRHHRLAPFLAFDFTHGDSQSFPPSGP